MTREEIARVIGHAETAGASFLIPMFRHAMEGQLNLVWPQRDTVMLPLRRMGKTGRPLAVILGDDDYATTGPSGWGCAVKLRTWAAAAIIHGTGGRPEHYALAAEMAVQSRRLLLIETSSASAQDWAAFLSKRSPKLPLLGVLPPDGAHPVTPNRGDLH